MIQNFFEMTQDWCLTKKTGKTKAQREWEEWYSAHVVQRATTIDNMFMHFKHVVIVDHSKFFDLREPFGWIPQEEAKQYFWPNRQLGDNAVWHLERVSLDRWDNKWHLDEIGGTDKVFVATNNDEDALIIALKWA